jgi:hypothetical protein
MYDGRYYMRAHWFQPQYGELFLELWNHYLKEVGGVERHHPFAFINLLRGEMYCLSHYAKAHAAACERVGLKVAKELGTTPQGHRNAYCRRLSEAGVAPEIARHCMHFSAQHTRREQ